MKPPSLRQASSVILVAKNTLIKHSTNMANDINILAIKRSANTSNLPGFHCFPGGNCEKADEASDWLRFLPSSELDVSLNLIDFRDGKPYNYVQNTSSISQAISLRISAIRETFEECGILLCKNRATDTRSSAMTHYEIENVKEWRHRVRENPSEFLNLCQQFNCYPSIKNLHLISNWISPPFLPKRFDCKFFIGIVDYEVEGEADNSEIEEIKWHSLNYFLEEKDIFLPPVQFYEMTALKNLKNFDTLCKMLKVVDTFPCVPIYAVHVNAQDGYILLLNGDEKYEDLKEKMDATLEVLDAECTMEEYRDNVMHRVEFLTNDKLITNIKEKGLVIIKNYDCRYTSLLKFLSQKNKL